MGGPGSGRRIGRTKPLRGKGKGRYEAMKFSEYRKARKKGYTLGELKKIKIKSPSSKSWAMARAHAYGGAKRRGQSVRKRY